MDIHNLEAFIEVADKKSFSRSAVSLNLTQPAVSKRIAALENELSSRLFDRMGRVVHLTEAGRVLLPSALKIYSEITRIEGEITNLGSEVKGTLSVGLQEHLVVENLTPVLKAFKDQYPDVAIDMNFTSAEEVLAALESGSLDLGLCTIDVDAEYGKEHAHLRKLELWNDQMNVVVESNHPLARFESVTLAELAEYPAILPQENSVSRKSIDKLMHSHDLTPIVVMETDAVDITQSMASIGLGWALLPEHVNDDALVTLSVESKHSEKFTYKQSVGLVRNQDRTMTRAAKAFLDSLQVQFH